MRNVWIRMVVLMCGGWWAMMLPAVAEPSGNLLVNGNFEAGEPAWLFHTEKDAKATFVVEHDNGNAVGHVTVTQTGKFNHVQFAYPFPQSLLAIGKVHCVTLRCRSSQPRTMRIVLIEANEPWGYVGSVATLQTTTEWKTHEFYFRPKAVPSPNLKLNFFLGETAGDFWLDDVTLAEASGEGRPETAQRLLSGDSELALGGDGSILSLKQVSSGLEVVGGIGKRPAFTLGLHRGNDTAIRSSADATRITAREGKSGAYVAEFPDLTVCFSYEPSERAGLFECLIAVENRSDWAVERVTFPILDCPEILGETSDDDRLLFPHGHGGLVENPRQAMTKEITYQYPGWTSCQLMSFFNPKAGLYAACHDPAGNVKAFNAGLDLNLRLSFDHLSPLYPGKDVAIPYPVVIGAFAGGTWYEPASIYRDWALAQDWLPKPLQNNERLPEWMRQGAIVDFHTPYKPDKEPLTDEEFRQRLDTIHKVSGLNVLAINWGWEHYGMWCAQEYFPPQPSDEAFRQHGAIACETGAGMVMLSGLRWTFEKQLKDGTMYSGKERFDREVKPWVTHTKSPDTPTVETGEPTHYKGSGYAEMCPGTDFAVDTFTTVAKRCLESGYPAIHFDQPTGPPYCLAPNHGHPPGYGTWSHEAMVNLFDHIRSTCAPLDKKFVLSMEESRELYLRECQLIQTRAQRLVCRTSPFTRDLPLFQFLYHEYQVGWCSAYPAHCHGQIFYSLAKGFAVGLMPGIVWDWIMKIKPDERREEYLATLGNYCRLYREEGLDFLLYGRMLKPLDVDIPQRTLKLDKLPDLVVPAVTHSVWQAQDGRRAVVFFNYEETPHTLRLPDGREVTVQARDGLLCELKD